MKRPEGRGRPVKADLPTVEGTIMLARKSGQSAITTCEYADCYNPGPYGLICGCLGGGCRWKGTQYNVEQVGR
jgi:hypothetical protein